MRACVRALCCELCLCCVVLCVSACLPACVCVWVGGGGECFMMGDGGGGVVPGFSAYGPRRCFCFTSGP